MSKPYNLQKIIIFGLLCVALSVTACYWAIGDEKPVCEVIALGREQPVDLNQDGRFEYLRVPIRIFVYESQKCKLSCRISALPNKIADSWWVQLDKGEHEILHEINGMRIHALLKSKPLTMIEVGAQVGTTESPKHSQLKDGTTDFHGAMHPVWSWKELHTKKYSQGQFTEYFCVVNGEVIEDRDLCRPYSYPE
jgi:hypothetical protein